MGTAGGGSDAFGGAGSMVLLSIGSGVLSAADVEASDGISAVSGSAVLSAEISVLSETEIVVFSCGTVLCAGSAITVSCEDGADTSERSAFVQPERESVSSTKTAMILACFICANLLCSFIVRIAAENCKAAAAGISLFSGSTGSFEGVRCGEGEHADTAVHPLKMGMAAPW